MVATLRQHRTLVYFFCVILLILLAAASLGAVAVAGIPQVATPPIGTWTGTLMDGRTVTFMVNEEGGYRLDGVPEGPIAGTWTWAPTSDTAGILGTTPADWPTHPMMDYTVTWMGPHRITLSCPTMTVELQRMF